MVALILGQLDSLFKVNRLGWFNMNSANNLI